MCSHGRWNVTSLRRSLVSSEGDGWHDRRDRASPRGHFRGVFSAGTYSFADVRSAAKLSFRSYSTGLSFRSLVASVVGGVEPDADIDPRHAGAANSQDVDGRPQSARPRVSGFEG